VRRPVDAQCAKLALECLHVLVVSTHGPRPLDAGARIAAFGELRPEPDRRVGDSAEALCVVLAALRAVVGAGGRDELLPAPGELADDDRAHWHMAKREGADLPAPGGVHLFFEGVAKVAGDVPNLSGGRHVAQIHAHGGRATWPTLGRPGVVRVHGAARRHGGVDLVVGHALGA
jgi:hypothetical protein